MKEYISGKDIFQLKDKEDLPDKAEWNKKRRNKTQDIPIQTQRVKWKPICQLQRMTFYRNSYSMALWRRGSWGMMYLFHMRKVFKHDEWERHLDTHGRDLRQAILTHKKKGQETNEYIHGNIVSLHVITEQRHHKYDTVRMGNKYKLAQVHWVVVRGQKAYKTWFKNSNDWDAFSYFHHPNPAPFLYVYFPMLLLSSQWDNP